MYLFFVYHQIIYYINFHLDTNEGRRLGLFSGLMLCSPPLFEQKISLKLPRRRLHLDLLGSCRVFELCLFDNKDKPPLQRLLRRKPPNKSSGDKKLMTTMVAQPVKLVNILYISIPNYINIYNMYVCIYVFRQVQQNHNGNAFKLVSLSHGLAHSSLRCQFVVIVVVAFDVN